MPSLDGTRHPQVIPPIPSTAARAACTHLAAPRCALKHMPWARAVFPSVRHERFVLVHNLTHVPPIIARGGSHRAWEGRVGEQGKR